MTSLTLDHELDPLDDLRWTPICPAARLPVERGVAALVDGTQVAVFRTADGRLHAVSNLDPFSGAMVLSRGIVGTRGDRPTVAGPVYKQVFDLETGQCLDDPGVRLAVHAVRVRDGIVEIAAAATAATTTAAPGVVGLPA